jgi:hypothetical protein
LTSEPRWFLAKKLEFTAPDFSRGWLSDRPPRSIPCCAQGAPSLDARTCLVHGGVVEHHDRAHALRVRPCAERVDHVVARDALTLPALVRHLPALPWQQPRSVRRLARREAALVVDIQSPPARPRLCPPQQLVEALPLALFLLVPQQRPLASVALVPSVQIPRHLLRAELDAIGGERFGQSRRRPRPRFGQARLQGTFHPPWRSDFSLPLHLRRPRVLRHPHESLRLA